ncbi:MAG: hypothetical protein MUC94_15190 [bacterium]|nr:hypothetical protein [bacterium]
MIFKFEFLRIFWSECDRHPSRGELQSRSLQYLASGNSDVIVERLNSMKIKPGNFGELSYHFMPK